jgi:hypothetical protein
VPKYPEHRRETFLTVEQIDGLGAVLRACLAEGSETPFVVAAFQLLILTGCRLSEIQTLRWSYVRDGYLQLPDSKTGARRIPFSPAAVGVLDNLPRLPGNEFVIAGEITGHSITDLQRPWRRIRARAGLEHVRIHDLRHTYASLALAEGLDLVMIGKLLGHRQIQTTMRYAHLADDPIRRAATQIGTPRKHNYARLATSCAVEVRRRHPEACGPTTRKDDNDHRTRGEHTMIRETLAFIGSNFLEASELPLEANAIANYIRHDAADAIVAALGNPHFLVKGSPGLGNWADVPWIAILDPTVTRSATRGYYVVYLFSANMTAVHLCLAQGRTEIREEFKSQAPAELRRCADLMRARVPEAVGRFPAGPIALHGSTSLARDYESSVAFSIAYFLPNLPSEDKLRGDLHEMVRLYSMLIARGGRDNFEDVSGSEGSDTERDTIIERRRYRLHRKIERAAGTAKRVKQVHGLTCQCCGSGRLGPFVSRLKRLERFLPQRGHSMKAKEKGSIPDPALGTTATRDSGKTLGEALQDYSDEATFNEFVQLGELVFPKLPERIVPPKLTFSAEPQFVQRPWTDSDFNRLSALLDVLHRDLVARLRGGGLSGVEWTSGAPRGTPPRWVAPSEWVEEGIDWDSSTLASGREILEVRVTDRPYKEATNYIQPKRPVGRSSRREEIQKAYRRLISSGLDVHQSKASIAVAIKQAVIDDSGRGKGLGEDAVIRAINEELKADRERSGDAAKLTAKHVSKK